MDAIKINIAEPCHENWQNMTGTEQGRFCGACKKEVIDFTMLSDNEVYKTMLRSDNDLCGRFLSTQLNNEIEYKLERKQNWHKYFFSLFIPAFLISKQSAAQKRQGRVACTKPVNISQPTVGSVAAFTSAEIKNLPPVTPVELLTGKPIMIVAGQIQKRFVDRNFELSGTIIDSITNESINASVQIKNSSYGVMTDSVGNFKLNGKVANGITGLTVTAIGYETQEIDIAIPVNNFRMHAIAIRLNKKMKQLDSITVLYSTSIRMGGRLGGVSYVSRRNVYKELPVRIITKLTDSLKIYPNPVKRGNIFNVDLKLKSNENYTLQLIDAGGKVFYQKQIKEVGKRYNQQVQADRGWASGIYFIRVIDSKNKLISTSRFIIE